MKKYVATIVLCFTILSLAANDFASETFKYKYQKKHYERFENVKMIDSTLLAFDDILLRMDFEDTTFKKIFSSGVFNLSALWGKEIKKPFFANKDKELTFCCVEELKELNPDFKTKRYKFWLFWSGLLNPTESYFEIYNEEATENSSFEEFLENAVMTFFWLGSMIL